jgi:cell division protease FtsH
MADMPHKTSCCPEHLTRNSLSAVRIEVSFGVGFSRSVAPDEIDTLPARGKSAHHDDWWSAIVNTLLEQLDGFERREGVVVVAACNDPSRLDAALVRAGRLDHHIAIPLPDVPALVGIFRVHLGGDLAGADLRPAALAARGHTGADVERWVRVAQRTARTAGRSLALQGLLEAVRGGEAEWAADVRRRIACHEAGHAITQLALDIAEPTALSIGGTGGLTESDLGEMHADTREHLEKFLVALLGGRAAEQLSFAEVTAGAGGAEKGSDLSRATRLATRLETDFGFGSLGLV